MGHSFKVVIWDLKEPWSQGENCIGFDLCVGIKYEQLKSTV